MNRIQKLLFSEYSDFDDMVLLESPFAEIKRNGEGVQQLQMGLTSSKLILATELLKYADEYPMYYVPGELDPEIDTMELISIFPVEFVSLSVFQRRRRKVFKVTLHDGRPDTAPRVKYLELGGIGNRKMYWLLWCEKVRYLSPSNQIGSATEASVGSSSSAASFVPSYTTRRGNKIWEYYSGPPPTREVSGQNLNYQTSAQTCFTEPKLRTIYSHNPEKIRADSVPFMQPAVRVNRFGEGVVERCSTGLYLPNSSDFTQSADGEGKTPLDTFYSDCVKIWRRKGDRSSLKNSKRLVPSPDLNHCVGVLSTDLAGTCTMQLKRSRSHVRIMEERVRVNDGGVSLENRMKGCQSLDNITGKAVSYQNNPYDYVLNFWTTDYWYTPDPVSRPLGLLKSGKGPDVGARMRAFFMRRRAKTSTEPGDRALARFKSSLRMDNHVCMWEIDSTALATQLTIIDSVLFLKIPYKELWFVKKQGHARNSRNLMTWIIFSHRIACLTASQILILPETKRRARLIARYIMVCEKCHRLGNQQSTMSILQGLQSPAIFRLYVTWARVRQYHSTAYNIFKHLCRLYSTSNVPELSRPPYLVSAKFYLDTLLGRLYFPEKSASNANSSSDLESTGIIKEADRKYSKVLNLKHIFSVFNMGPCDDSTESLPRHVSCDEPASISDVSLSPSSLGLNTVLGVLMATKEAARKYELCPNRQAREFLLKVPYQEHYVNFQHSLSLEPPS